LLISAVGIQINLSARAAPHAATARIVAHTSLLKAYASFSAG
jgi:hypothetical protein